MPTQVWPFTGGENDAIDSTLLPDGLIRRADNLRLERDGRLGIRPGYTNLALTTYGTGTFVPYDLAVYRERVVALGDRFGYGVATDLYELQPAGSVNAWRPTDPDASPIRIPALHSPRVLGQQVDQEDGVVEFQQAASVTHLCTVTRSTAGSYVHVVNVDTNQTVLYEKLTATLDPLTLLRVAVASSGDFAIIGVPAAATSVTMVVFDPAVDSSLSTGVTLFTSAFTVLSTAIAASGANVIVCSGRNDGNTLTSLFSLGGSVLQVMGTVSLDTVLDVSEPDFTGNCVAIWEDNKIYAATLNTSSVSVIAGPTIFPATDGLATVNAGIYADAFNSVSVAASLTVAQDVVMQSYTASTGVFAGSAITFPDLTMTALPYVAIAGNRQIVVFGAVSGNGTGDENGSPSTAFYQARTFDSSSILVAAALDFELGATPLTIPPSVVASGDLLYLPRMAVNEDGNPAPSVLQMSSAVERRQWAAVGSALYFAGGTVLRYAGRCITETEFHERPRVVSITPSNGAGALLPGAEYDYRIHWEWIDEIGELARSAVSDIFSVTMGAADDTNTLLGSTPHSLRTSAGSKSLGSAVRLVAERTAATVTNVAAALEGANVLDLTAVNFTGKTVFVQLEDSVGSVNLSYTFAGNPASVDALVIELNADSAATASGRAIYSHAASRVTVTTVEAGENTSLSVPVSPSSANIDIGWLGSATDTGTTVRTKGTNFHRTQVDYLAVSDDPGTPHTLVDTRIDQTDPIDTDVDLIAQGTVYTQSNPTGSDLSPLPCSYIASGHDRAITAGQAQPSQWSVSKLSVRNQALAWTDESLLSFSGEIRGDILAVVQFGESIILWTEREMWAVSGQGPGQNGAGEYFAPRRIPTDGGMKVDGWKSIIETAAGLFFQLDDDKIYLLTRSLGLEWVSFPVTRRLEDFPVVKDVAHTVGSQEIVWALANIPDTLGGHIRLDLRTNQWFFDNVGVSDAIVSEAGRLVGLTGGVPYRQDVAAGTGAAVVAILETGDFQGFQRLGWGQVEAISLLGTWRDDCNVKSEISSDSGLTWVELSDIALTSTDYSVGGQVTLQYEPPVQMLETFRVRFTITPEASSAGIYINAFAVDTTKSPGAFRAPNQSRS